MKKIFLLAIITFSAATCFAGTNDSAAAKQYLLIFRFKANFVPPSQDSVQANIRRWQVYMGNLGSKGKLVAGYRPGNEGETIAGTAKAEQKGAYIANNELISSFIIIKAASLEEADEIAKQCPIFEFDGSVEIRPLMEQAR